MTLIISSATRSVQVDQTSTTLLYFSPLVIRPSRYCCSYSLTCSCASLMRPSLEPGTTRSRSEEHTSELQSLMRISYAVFCLKKKKIQQHIKQLQQPYIKHHPYT